MLVSCKIFLLSNKNSVNEFCLNESLKWHRAYSVKFVISQVVRSKEEDLLSTCSQSSTGR